ncbi:MAG: TonB-dependent receptor [Bacteroidota bacterium]
MQSLLGGILYAGTGLSQGRKMEDIYLTVKVENISLHKAFEQIRQKTDIEFTYNHLIINEDDVISLAFENQSLFEILTYIAGEKKLKFKRINNNIHVNVNTGFLKQKAAVEEEVSQITIKGKVTTVENGEALPGVSILIKGTSTGTVSDLNGSYLLPANEGDILQFSFIGYQTKEVEIGNRTIVDVQLTQDLEQLEEVVVIGYGSQKRSDLTGSISSVSGEEIEKLAATSLEQGLQGRAAGVQVTQTDASPGGAISVRIRGGNSITGNNEPLYVIDGYPIMNQPITATGRSGSGNNQVIKTNPLAALNPNDIASIEVLKDASATAIYGARGANGVVIITTKRGKSNTSNFDIHFSTGVQEIIKTMPVLNLRDYAELANEAFVTDGRAAPFPDVDGLVDSLNGGTNWQDEIFTTAPMYNVQLTYTGGNEKSRYMVSGNYFKQEGIVIGSDFQRYSTRFNLDTDVSSKFRLGYSLNLSYIDNEEVLVNDGGTGSAGVVHNALTAAPYLPVFDEEGAYFVDWQQVGPVFRRDNPVSLALSTTNNTLIGRGLGNFYAQYEIIEGLTAKVTIGADVQYIKRNLYIPRTTYRGFFPRGIADVQTNQVYNWLNENTLTYQKNFNQNHRLTALLGYTMQRENRQTTRSRGEGFVNDILGFNNIEAASVVQPPSTGANQWSLQSYIGRVNYVLSDKYLFTLTGRVDGSSRFGENNKYGFFPSGAFAWRMSEESFIKEMNFFSDLKLRTSYGITGNQEIPLYRSQASLGNTNYILGGSQAIGIAPNRVANPDLKWESTTQFDVGLDVGFIDNRLRFTLDHYRKKTEDLLLQLTIPWTSGYSSSLQNVGSVENIGWEFSAGADILTGELRWSVEGNISTNRNEVLDLGELDQFFGPQSGAPGFYSPGPAVIVKEGEPVNSFFGYETNGLFRTQADIDNGPTQRFQELGDRRFSDTDGDGELSPDDRVILGTAIPDFIYGFNSNLSYKNFDLSLFFQGVQGNEVLNVLRIYELESLRGTHNNHTRVLDRWSSENPNGSEPKADRRGQERFVTDENVEDGSFLRLRNVVLGYTLPASKINWLRELRVYVSAQNLFTITNYTGFDPEVNSQGQNPINQGIDYGAYPRARVFNVGFNIGF